MTSEQERTFRILCGAVVIAGLVGAVVLSVMIALN
jgi:hypothetical protein